MNKYLFNHLNEKTKKKNVKLEVTCMVSTFPLQEHTCTFGISSGKGASLTDIYFLVTAREGRSNLRDYLHQIKALG